MILYSAFFNIYYNEILDMFTYFIYFSAYHADSHYQC